MERPSAFDDDEDDDEFGNRRDSSSQKGDSTGMIDGKSGSDQRPSTPRSKHSVTEQRRRCKINDRFQILRELIPHSDQKRDKASFLLEVIEYTRFLQEKVQKYESSYPNWTEENAKLLPWNNSQGRGDGIADHSHQAIKNGSAPPEFIFSGKFDDNIESMAPAMLSVAQNSLESDLIAAVSYKSTEAPPHSNLYPSGRDCTAEPQQLISDAENMASQSRSQWLRSPCPNDCTVSGDVLNEQEELAIDEGTISVSSAYSQGLLTTLTQVLQSSGIDMSQASISVQINLRKRTTSRIPTAAATTSFDKENDDPSSENQEIGQSRVVGSSGEESSKRHKLENR